MLPHKIVESYFGWPLTAWCSVFHDISSLFQEIFAGRDRQTWRCELICPYKISSRMRDNWGQIHRLRTRGEAFMLAVLARLTLWKTKNKVLLSWFSGTPYTGTQRNRSAIMPNQPIIGVVSQLVEAYGSSLFAQAQLEEPRYSVGLRGGGTVWPFKPRC
jgi:hypothetical protein